MPGVVVLLMWKKGMSLKVSWSAGPDLFKPCHVPSLHRHGCGCDQRGGKERDLSQWGIRSPLQIKLDHFHAGTGTLIRNLVAEYTW